MERLLEERIKEDRMTLDEIEAVVEGTAREVAGWVEDRLIREQQPEKTNRSATPVRHREPLPLSGRQLRVPGVLADAARAERDPELRRRANELPRRRTRVHRNLKLLGGGCPGMPAGSTVARHEQGMELPASEICSGNGVNPRKRNPSCPTLMTPGAGAGTACRNPWLPVPTIAWEVWWSGSRKTEWRSPTNSGRERGRGRDRLPSGAFQYAYEYGSSFREWQLIQGTERCVELALGRAALEGARGRVLEIGDRLREFGLAGHDVVDPLASGSGRAELDAFYPEGPYDLILSISTLQHFGPGSGDAEPDRIEALLRRVRREWLASGGRFLATAPLGCSASLDRLIRQGRTGTQVAFLRRVSAANEWREVKPASVSEPRYGEPFPGANFLAVLSL